MTPLYVRPGDQACETCFWYEQLRLEHGRCRWTPPGLWPQWAVNHMGDRGPPVQATDGEDCTTFWRDERAPGETSDIGLRPDEPVMPIDVGKPQTRKN